MSDSEQTPPAPAKAAAPKRRGTKGTPPSKENVLGALAEAPAPQVITQPEPQPAEPAAAPATPKAKDGKGKARKTEKVAKERSEPLNFRVTVEFRKAFKRAAAQQDCKKVELLERIFAEWQTRNPA